MTDTTPDCPGGLTNDCACCLAGYDRAAQARTAERTRLLKLMDRLVDEGMFTIESFRRFATMSIAYGPIHSTVSSEGETTTYTVTQNVQLIDGDHA